jgi:hypothetical protein
MACPNFKNGSKNGLGRLGVKFLCCLNLLAIFTRTTFKLKRIIFFGETYLHLIILSELVLDNCRNLNCCRVGHLTK